MADEKDGSPKGVAADQEPGQAPPPSAQPVQPTQVDLTQIPQFQKLQSKLDQRIAALEADNMRIKAEADRLRAEAQARELQGLDALAPEEQAAKLKNVVNSLRQKERETEAQQEMIAKAQRLVQRGGVDPNDARLAPAWRLGPTQAGLDALAETILDIQRQDKETETQTWKQRLEALEKGTNGASSKAVAQAKVQALNEAGVTSVSSGAPSAIGESDPNAEAIRDFKRRLKALTGKGIDNPGYRNLVEDLRKKGLTTGDL